MAYFETNKLDLQDAINQHIWSKSVTVQAAIQDTNDLRQKDAIGAQQAMLSPVMPEGSVLPWITDMVGRDWRAESAMLVIGAAYAGIINEFSRRTGSIALAEYCRLSKQAAGDFQKRFVETVVQDYTSYYVPVSQLLDGVVDLTHLALFDLCRASFVKRGGDGNRRKDSWSARKTICVAPALFSDYTEWWADPEGEDVGPGAWTWLRIRQSSASSVVALGQIAEHGVLRAFQRNLKNPKIVLRCDPEVSPQINLNSSSWSNSYAHEWYKMQHWVPFPGDQTVDPNPNEVDWWCVTGIVDDRERAWKVLPIYHPSQNQDTDYVQSRKRLKIMHSAQ
jgi:hypothetical protein